jgi:hypothetical protein
MAIRSRERRSACPSGRRAFPTPGGTKFQISTPAYRQAGMTKIQNKAVWVVGNWRLNLDLIFRIWSLEFEMTRVPRPTKFDYEIPSHNTRLKHETA